MSNVVRLDPLLARRGLRGPTELDGHKVLYCKSVSVKCDFTMRVLRSWVDAEFVLEGVPHPVLASTIDGGKTWETVVCS